MSTIPAVVPTVAVHVHSPVSSRPSRIPRRTSTPPASPPTTRESIATLPTLVSSPLTSTLSPAPDQPDDNSVNANNDQSVAVGDQSNSSPVTAALQEDQSHSTDKHVPLPLESTDSVSTPPLILEHAPSSEHTDITPVYKFVCLQR